jgi:hypothetical protein
MVTIGLLAIWQKKWGRCINWAQQQAIKPTKTGYGRSMEVLVLDLKLRFQPRGFNTNVSVGKVFRVLSPNANSGIYTHVGFGYTQHKLRVETQDHYIPLLETNYRKGYDRYTSGLNTHQFLGYCFLADNGLVNFYGGFYVQEGFTKNRREIFFDQPSIPVDKKTQLEIQYGFRVGWFVPIYKRKPKDFYYG